MQEILLWLRIVTNTVTCPGVLTGENYIFGETIFEA